MIWEHWEKTPYVIILAIFWVLRLYNTPSHPYTSPRHLQTSTRHPQTPYRHPPHTLQTPFRNSQDALYSNFGCCQSLSLFNPQYTPHLPSHPPDIHRHTKTPQTPFVHYSDTLQMFSRHPSETLKTPSKAILDVVSLFNPQYTPHTLQTHIDAPDTLCTLSGHPPDSRRPPADTPQKNLMTPSGILDFVSLYIYNL